MVASIGKKLVVDMVHNTRSRTDGFTLIELMIVVAIVAILTAIALPNYGEHVRRAKRTDAKAALLENAQILERQMSMSGTYATNGTPPIAVSPRGATGVNVLYNITFTALSVNAFTLQAAPANSQAGDDCGNYTLTSAGTRGLSGNTLSVADCWNR